MAYTISTDVMCVNGLH